MNLDPHAPRVIVVPPGTGPKSDFLRRFAQVSNFETMYAANWDAFADVLSDFVAGSPQPVELCHVDPPRLSAEDSRTYRSILSDLADELPGRLTVRWPAGTAPPDRDGAAGTPTVAVAHYHLNRGGVTRVVANHLLGLAAAAESPPSAVLLTGGRAEAWGPHADELDAAGVSAARPVVAGLDYDDLNPGVSRDQRERGPGDPTRSLRSRLTDRMEQALADHGATRDATVLHIHNHALGKNVALPGAVAELARGGWKLLLQPHDFAEEFRPANHLKLTAALGEGAVRFPQAPQIHYAVLNGRDRDVLRELGVPEGRLHFLPNPVADFPPLPDRRAAKRALEEACGVPADQKYLCYPVRGIRRKNLGEAVLTALLEPDSVVGVTLEPRNPAELKFHEFWRTLAADLDLPVRFGTGEEGGIGFHENLAAADAILTTSVAEGFGMVFLECWLAGRPLIGRDLPHVTGDFRAEGLKLPGLYESLTVPLDWAPGWADDFRAGCERLLSDYRRPWDEAAFAEALAAKTAGGRVDFADLNEEAQAAVIRRLADDPAARGDVCSVEADRGRPTDGVVERNAAVVRDRYDLAGSGARLRAVYDAVLASDVGPVEPPPRPGAVLDAFLDLKTFRLIRGS